MIGPSGKIGRALRERGKIGFTFCTDGIIGFTTGTGGSSGDTDTSIISFSSFSLIRLIFKLISKVLSSLSTSVEITLPKKRKN